MGLEYIDTIPDWSNGLSFPSSDIFNSSNLGDISAPNDTLAKTVDNAVNSVGNSQPSFLQKTADLFSSAIGSIAQAASAWETIFAPKDVKPDNPQDHSQLPSLQPVGDTSGQLSNWQNLASALSNIIYGRQSNIVSVPATQSSYLPTVFIVGIIAVVTYFIVRGEK